MKNVNYIKGDFYLENCEVWAQKNVAQDPPKALAVKNLETAIWLERVSLHLKMQNSLSAPLVLFPSFALFSQLRFKKT